MSTLQELAEGYALGLLDAAEAAEVEARLADPRGGEDHALIAEVGALRDRLLPLDLTAPELPLRPGAWDRLEAALGAAGEGPDRAVREVSGRALRQAAGPEAPAAIAPSAPGGWRLAALASMAATAMLAVALGWQLFAAREPAVLVVLLDQASGSPVALLEAYADNSVRVTPLTGVEPGPSQVLQLWTKPDPAGPPVSVGLLEAAARMLVEGPDLPAPGPGQLYEITVEQAGGSPTGLPTGPIVGVGNAQAPVLE